jgi:carbon monoxide dehydrogenase subunit G
VNRGAAAKAGMPRGENVAGMIDVGRVIELPHALAEVWRGLREAPGLGRCVPGCQDTQEVEPGRRYRATVRERVGPYSVEIPLEVIVDPLEEGVRLAVRVSGRDPVLSSTVKASMIAALAAGDSGTSLTIQGRLEVGGKLAALGEAVIQRKTRDILGEFAVNLERFLKGLDASAAP